MPDNYITLPQLTKTTKGLVNKINTESTVINSKIGNLANLNTTTKTDLVAAINEAASSSGTTYDDTALAGRVTALENAGYITSYTETDPTVPAWAKEATKPTYTATEVGALPDTTTIPTKTSDLTNDSGFIASTDLAPIATSGSYNDLRDTPTIPENKIFPINVTLTSLTQGTSDKTHTEILNAITTGKIPIVNASFNNIKMVAFLTHSSPEYAIFTYLNQLDSSVIIKYAEMRIINNIVTLTNLTDRFITSIDVPAATSQLTNDSGFITTADIPTTTSQLINDSGFITNSDVPALATVATSGDYDDLINKPTIPAAQVQSDWNATSGMGVILNKPTIPAATTVTNTLASGTLIATINGTNIYAPAYTDVDWVSY